MKYLTRKLTTRTPYLILLIALSSADLFSQPGTWVQKASGYGATASINFSINGKGYFGLTASSNTFWEYDPATDAWTQKADFPGLSRHANVSFSTDTKGYVGGGISQFGAWLDEFWEYDPATNAWTQKTNFPGGLRYNAIGFAVSGKGYMGLGYNGSYLKDLWEYDPTTNAWAARTNLTGVGREGAFAFAAGGKGYVGGGKISFAGAHTNDFWEFDPVGNSWIRKADFPSTSDWGSRGISIGVSGYVGGGRDEAIPANLADFWEYRPLCDLWIRKADFGGGIRAGLTGFSIGGKGYLGAGSPGGPIGDFWEFTPAVALPNPTISSFVPASGVIGASVTITGTNFDVTPEGNVVKFNGTTATVISSTSTSLVVTVPAGATTGSITVQTSCNPATSASNFTVSGYTPFGNVITMNGANDLIVVADNVALQPPSLTIEAWVNFSALTPGVIVGRARNQPGTSNNSFAIYYAGGSLFSIVNSTVISVPWTPVIGTWYHLALTYNNVTQRQTLFANGTAVASLPTTAPIIYTAANLTIGADVDFGSNVSFLNGKIDEVRFWGIARTAAEISSTINSTLTGGETNLITYYKMNEVGQGAGITTVNSATATGAILNGTTVGTTCTPIFTMINAPTVSSFTPAFGSVGTSITITGTNFDPTPANNTVRINGTLATVTASSTTSITTTVPAGGSSGSITVQVGCNTATSSTNFFVPVCFPANGQNADVVLGQANFTTNTPGSGANRFNGAGGGIAIHHASGKVFVTDQANSRVLRFGAVEAATTGSSAEAVLGQPDFTTTTAGLSQSKMNNPVGLAIDQTTGVLWVADYGNNRVLRFDNAILLPNGAPASGVLGQPDFTTSASPIVTADKLGGPAGVALDANGDLWTAERPWNRVLKFPNAAALPNGAAASVVIGQTNFNSNFPGFSASAFNRTNGVAIDILGNLWVADELNNRVLKFTNAASLATGASANVVLGQINFFANAPATAQNRMYGPMTVHGDIFGNLWVGDWVNQRALQFANAASLSSGANATKVLGSPNFTTIAGGIAQNRTGVVWAIAVDNFGNVFVGDQGNNRILRFNAPMAALDGGLTSTCANTSVSLTSSGAAVWQEYRWYDVPSGGTSLGSTATFTTPLLTATKTFFVSVADAGCGYESSRVPVEVTVNPVPSPPTVIQPAPSVAPSSFTLLANGGTPGQYRWYEETDIDTPISGATASSLLTPILESTTSYFVSLHDGNCESELVEVTAIIENEGSLGIYNALSPNGDGMNETFFIENIDKRPDTQENKVTIFNRWGTVVYETTNYDNVSNAFSGIGKNGNELPPGTYYYSIEFSSGAPKRTGFISLRK